MLQESCLLCCLTCGVLGLLQKNLSSVNGSLFSFFWFADDDEDMPNLPMTDGDDEESVILRRNIVARQLSGDPSKINPALSLNQQAQALAYNPKLEIDRYSHFN